ncbi:MAG: ABC transporter permease subunit [Coriobacteriales bacterium]|jgi:sodium transport system permease protein|nr:ABC transporter permease subunit [Coriobacteriales bacterium]
MNDKLNRDAAQGAGQPQGASRARGASNGLVAIMAKEFRRFFTDRRMVITTLLLPGLMIYATYSVMGSAMQTMFSVSEDYEYQVAAVNLPASIKPLTEQAGLDFVEIDPASTEQIAQIKQRLSEKDYDLLAVFPADFDARLQSTLGGDAPPSTTPDIELYYNSTHTQSATAHSLALGLLDSYKNALLPLFSVNANSDVAYDLVTKEDEAGFMLSMLLPMFMMIVLFSGAIGVAPESIAGEKERGTIATILVTPLKRWQLALGKVVSLSCIALLGGASSFIGLMASLPRMLGASGAPAGDGPGVLLYSTTDYLMLLLVIISTLLLFIGLISLLSAFARSVKEAGTLVSPLMILVMVIGALGIFSQSAQENLLFYMIPIYNSVQCMVGIFSFTYDTAAIALTLLTNLVLSGVCVVVLTKMFNSERIVFSR